MSNILYEPVNFRGDITPVPIYEGTDLTRDLLSERLNLGLISLVENADATKVEYAGFHLEPYFTIDDNLAMDYEAVEALKEALKGIGLNTEKKPLASVQSILPSGNDCFDWIRLKDAIWNRGEGYKISEVQSGHIDTNLFMISPIVRIYTDETYDRDEYNQRKGLIVSLDSSIIIDGEATLEFVRESHPQIDLPIDMQPEPYLLNSTIVKSIARALKLVERDTSYEDWQIDVFKKFGFGSPFSDDGMSVLPRKSSYLF